MADKRQDKDFIRQMIDLFNSVSNAIRKNGHAKVMSYLKRIEGGDNPTMKKLELNILKICADEYSVNISDVVETMKRGDTFLARNECMYYFYKYLKMSEYKIAKYFNRSVSAANLANRYFKELTENHITDKEILTHHQNIEVNIQEFLKNNK
jgi:chromosomal replication initiation ATPase DnaA